jgi:epoxyqueuosine reductase
VAAEEVISALKLEALARAAGFDLVGFARAEPIPKETLSAWIESGFAADMDWLGARLEDRLDVARLLPGAKTVVALACNYWRSDAPSLVARYARGRDYHATLRDRLRTLRRTFRQSFPQAQDYGSVDATPVMEKVWAARAGLGYVGRHGCLITPEHGSWVVLTAFIIDREVDAYAKGPTADRCAGCRLCVNACPTDAIVADQTVDAGKCLSYQTIENVHPVPEALRAPFEGTIFGCDICQDVCPHNAAPLLGGERFAPRAVADLDARALAAMSKEDYARWIPGTALARAQYDGLRRNAVYALGAKQDAGARELLQRLVGDESAAVREAAAWALEKLGAA